MHPAVCHKTVGVVDIRWVSIKFPLSWLTTNHFIMFRTCFVGLILLVSTPAATGQEEIEEAFQRALSYYPALKETSIQLVFTNQLKHSIMAARPTVGSLFKKRKKRTYKILINPAFKLGYTIDSISRIPDSVMMGWLGHELGHIADYENKSTWSIIGMGVSYWLSRNYVRKAERVADTYAVASGMADYLVTKKQFILNHTELPLAYRTKIETLYPSPGDIDKLAAELGVESNGKHTTLPVGEEEVDEENETEAHSESVPGNS